VRGFLSQHFVRGTKECARTLFPRCRAQAPSFVALRRPSSWFRRSLGSEWLGVCDKKPHTNDSALIAWGTPAMHAAYVSSTARFRASALFVPWLVWTAACAGSGNAATDGGSAPNDGSTPTDAAGKSEISPTYDATGDAIDDGAAVADGGPTTSDTTPDADDAPPCTPDPDPPVNCPKDLPPDDDCPDAAPSYTAEVASIIARRCTVCHRAGGVGAAFQFDTYAKIAANNNRAHMVTQVYMCRMPPSCADALLTDERQKLLHWLVCGGPNN
jgi:hypothetical protein